MFWWLEQQCWVAFPWPGSPFGSLSLVATSTYLRGLAQSPVIQSAPHQIPGNGWSHAPVPSVRSPAASGPHCSCDTGFTGSTVPLRPLIRPFTAELPPHLVGEMETVACLIGMKGEGDVVPR
jgi:hypothetical protein